MIGWSATQGAWFWLFLPALLVVYLLQRGNRRLSAVRTRAALLLRLTIVLLLLAAAADLHLLLPSRTQLTIFVRDGSDSLPPGQRAADDRFIAAALAAAPDDAQAALVSFAGEALFERAPTTPQQLAAQLASRADVPLRGSTDIGSALSLALAGAPPDVRPRLVLLSDGRDTAGNLDAALADAAARGIPIDVVAYAAAVGAEAAISAVRAPGNVSVGQRATISVELAATQAQTATLTLIDARGLSLSRLVQLNAGTQTEQFQVTLDRVGQQRFRLQLAAPQDRLQENNQATALIEVGGPPRVLLIAAEPAQGQALLAALTAVGIAAELRAAADAPADLAALSDYAALVLINTPAAALPTGFVAQLPTYVRELGNGLLMIGGNQSYALGGYAGGPLEQILPVTMDVRTRVARQPAAIIYLIDSSGSMDTCHCTPDNSTNTVLRARKLDLAREAAAQSAALLGSDDEAAVITFDDTALVRLGLRRTVTAADVQAALAVAAPTGATSLRAGLLRAEQELSTSSSERRHILLVSDGWTSDGDAGSLATRLQAAGISLSVIGVGSGTSAQLAQLAEAGGGRYYAVEDLRQLNAIFVQETLTVFGAGAVEQTVTPTLRLPARLAPIEAPLPQLTGYNGATPRASAQVVIDDGNGEALLVTHQIGLGRSTAWLSDLHGNWSADWLNWERFPEFAGVLIDTILPRAGESGRADVTLDVRSDRTLIAVRGGPLGNGLDVTAGVIDAQGTVSWLTLQPDGSGGYQAELPDPEPGSYVVSLSATQSGQLIAQQSSGLVVPYAAEYRLAPAVPDRSDEIRAQTGGRLLDAAADVWQPSTAAAARSVSLAMPCLWLALLLWPLDIAVRRLMLPLRVRRQLVHYRETLLRLVRRRMPAERRRG